MVHTKKVFDTTLQFPGPGEAGLARMRQINDEGTGRLGKVFLWQVANP